MEIFKKKNTNINIGKKYYKIYISLFTSIAVRGGGGSFKRLKL